MQPLGSLCNHWTHKSCVHMSTASYDRLGDSDEQWTCPKCHSNNISAKLYTIPSDTGNSSHHFSENISVQQMSSIPSAISSPGLSCTIDTEQHSSQSVNSPGRCLDSEIGMTSPKAQTTPNQTHTHPHTQDKRRNPRILNSDCQSVKRKVKT